MMIRIMINKRKKSTDFFSAFSSLFLTTNIAYDTLKIEYYTYFSTIYRGDLIG